MLDVIKGYQDMPDDERMIYRVGEGEGLTAPQQMLIITL
jgi:hypothetical protein